jgi:hypothetical protein
MAWGGLNEEHLVFGFWFAYSPFAEDFRTAFRRLQPLAPGKEERFLALFPGGEVTHTVRVVGRETVTLPAGTFDTWRFRWSADRGPWFAGEVDFWMSDVGMRVKQQGRVIRGSPDPRPRYGGVWRTRWEALSVTVPQAPDPNTQVPVRGAAR